MKRLSPERDRGSARSPSMVVEELEPEQTPAYSLGVDRVEEGWLGWGYWVLGATYLKQFQKLKSVN